MSSESSYLLGRIPTLNRHAGGAPKVYSEEVAQEFLRRMAGGEKLVEICADPAMPSWNTITRWRDTRLEFAQAYKKARVTSAEALEHEAFVEGWDADDKDSAIVARLRFDIIKWAASKRSPSEYAEKHLHTGADGIGAIQHEVKFDYSRLSVEELIQLKELLDKAKVPKIEEPDAPQIDGEVMEMEQLE